ncbi:hypothetical protein D0Z07_3183 [Hyphodiscus hymeniophilus]|uniref:SnoaL-like domain-containing protein n=1 Tax=Hyphodiscus hymeniophilus TaxID=353542 RepID=A0A9P7AY34_9HELO|nr:hypothetical protein D0Z07_3183 [Hyphodiscus hymeniophilus]
MAIRSLIQLSILAFAFASSCLALTTLNPRDTPANGSSQAVLEEPFLKFDDTRIADNCDKVLLSRIKTYFDAFVNGDADALRDQEAPEYNITDIPLTLVRLPREPWYQANKAFVSLTADTQVIAISLYGSSRPGAFAIMENVIWFTLTGDPGPGALEGYKVGDRVGMIMLTALWWNAGGKVVHELEYGRLTWEGFNITEFYQ